MCLCLKYSNYIIYFLDLAWTKLGTILEVFGAEVYVASLLVNNKSSDCRENVCLLRECLRGLRAIPNTFYYNKGSVLNRIWHGTNDWLFLGSNSQPLCCIYLSWLPLWKTMKKVSVFISVAGEVNHRNHRP